MQKQLQEQKPLPEDIKNYVKNFQIYRSPVQQLFFNVVAISHKGKPLFVQEADLPLEKAQELAKQLNKEIGVPEDEET